VPFALLTAFLPFALAAQGSVSVMPDGGSLTALANQSGLQATFYVFDNSGNDEVFDFSCSRSGAVTACQTEGPRKVSGNNAVTVTFSTGAPGSGILTFSARGRSSGSNDQGYHNVTVAYNGPVVSLLPHNGDYRDVTKCVENCFDGVTSYATVPYFSADVPRSIQLTYRSAQAHPMGIVQVNAVDTSTVNPVKMSIQLYTSQATRVTFTNGSQEIFYNWVSHPGDGNVNRLAAEFDASGLTTGAYNYTVIVRSYRSDGSFREGGAPIRLLVANQGSSAFGAGWSISGFQRLYPQANLDAVITDGSGSISYFTRGVMWCAFQTCSIPYTSPNGDFSTLRRDSVWFSAPGVCSNPPCVSYTRGYPAGPGVVFDVSGLMKRVGGGLFLDFRTKSLYFAPRDTFVYNASNRLVAMTDSTGKTISIGYDVSNHLRWIKDPGGRVDSIWIGASGNLDSIKDWAVITSPTAGQAIKLQYDANHRLTRWADRRGAAWDLTYDFAWTVATVTAPQVTANGQAVRPVVTYASLEHKVLIDPASGQGSSTNPGPNLDTAVVRATVTNARGYQTTYALDRFGAPTLVQEPLGRTSVFARDANSAITRSVAPSGSVTKFTWNGPDLTQTVDSMTGRTINYAYVGNRVSTISGDIDSVVNHWTGKQLDSTHTGGSGWVKFTYGADGRACTIVDPGGHPTSCHFTSNGFQNTDSISYALGAVGYRYDGHGQRVLTIDQVNDTTRTVYDSIGRLTATIGPLHDTTQVFYDDSLHLTRTKDAKGQVYRVWPNALGWPDSTKDPAGGVDRYQYDVNGNQTSWTNRNGRTIAFTYDSLDQLRSVVADAKTTTYFFDPAGHYVAVSNSESTDSLWSDAADRASRMISCRVLVAGNAPQCFRDSSVYEIRDNRTQAILTAPAIWGTTQFLVGYHYDVHELLDTLTPGRLNLQTGQPIRFVYSAEGMDSVRTLTGLNNLTITHSYPWTHRTDQVELSDATLSAALGTAYNFDNAGRMATRYHGSLTNPDTTRTFTYDRAGQVAQYADTVHHYGTSCTWYQCGYYCHGTDTPTVLGTTTYAYDSVWNRKDQSAPNGGLDTANRLRRWQSYRMDYDAAGNMTVKRTLSAIDTTKVLRRDSLFWSALGRLDSVRTRDSIGTLTGRVGFGYDAWGRRVRKSTASGTSRYLWDDESLTAQVDTLGNLVAGYTYYPGIDNFATQLRHDRADSTYYYLADYSRNVVALLARTGAGNTVDNQYRYEPFGNLQGTNPSSVTNSMKFAGREYDDETQLYYDRARYLDPALGRFVSEDPIGLGGGMNLYAFVGNDPINGWDPSGTRCRDFALNREKVSDKLAHYEFGEVAVKLARHFHWPTWTATKLGVLMGLLHEGPWGKLNTNFPHAGFMGDHDLWGWRHGARGAPCVGFFDTFFFMLAPLIYDITGYDPGFGKVVLPRYPVGDPRGGSSIFPNILPPMIPPGLRPGWSGWWITL
jgi:RHS repeat-associated protein